MRNINNYILEKLYIGKDYEVDGYTIFKDYLKDHGYIFEEMNANITYCIKRPNYIYPCIYIYVKNNGWKCSDGSLKGLDPIKVYVSHDRPSKYYKITDDFDKLNEDFLIFTKNNAKLIVKMLDENK